MGYTLALKWSLFRYFGAAVHALWARGPREVGLDGGCGVALLDLCFRAIHCIIMLFRNSNVDGVSGFHTYPHIHAI